MTTAAPGTTYRYVSDGSLVDRLHRDGLARLRHPLAVTALVVVSFGWGIGASLLTYSDSLPVHLGRVLLIGLFWGAVFLVIAAVFLAGLVPLIMWFGKRMLSRQYAPGLVTEVELADDALVVRRSRGTRSIPYGTVFRAKRRRSFLSIELRGSFPPVMLPPDLLPDDALAYIRTRASGRLPAASVPPPSGEFTRRFVAPAGWPAHVAAVRTRASLLGRAFWIRFAGAVLVSLPLALLSGPGWLVLAAAFALLWTAVTYERTRRTFVAATPGGSVATTEFLDDRFVSRNHGGAREIRYDDVRSVDVRGDVVLLRLSTMPGVMLIARALVPDDAPFLRARRPAAG